MIILMLKLYEKRSDLYYPPFGKMIFGFSVVTRLLEFLISCLLIMVRYLVFC
jgi:hypothetical protein